MIKYKEEKKKIIKWMKKIKLNHTIEFKGIKCFNNIYNVCNAINLVNLSYERDLIL